LAFDERAYIARIEAAGPDEFGALLRAPSAQEEDALRTYLGDARFDRMHEMAVMQGSGVRTLAQRQGNVIVIHGIMGGELTVLRNGSQRQIWARVLRLAAGGIGDLRLDDHGRKEADPTRKVEATGIMKKHYGELILTLSANWDTRAFWFDWRRNLTVAASLLEARATEWFGADAPFHIVAHSMGGLVARTFILQYPQRWARMTELDPELRRGGRLIMLGTPNHGSFAIPQIMTGLEGMVRKLALIDLKHSRGDLQAIVSTFAGSYNMMPSPLRMPEVEPLYTAATWSPLRVAQDLLDEARRHHEALARVVDPKRMIYVAGANRPTLVGIDPMKNVHDEKAYKVSYDGDGRVPHRLGLLDGVDTYWVEVDHGALSSDVSVVNSLDELMRTGKSRTLPATKPSVRGDAANARAEMTVELELDEAALMANVRRTRAARAVAEDEPEYLSTDEREAEDLLTRGWLSGPDTAARSEGNALPADSTAARPVLQLRLVQGSIGDAKVLRSGKGAATLPVDAIAVGHYRDVRPTNAELAIDRAITSALLKIPEAKLEEAQLIITQFTERGTIPGGLGQPFFVDDPRESRTGRVVVLAGMGRPGSFGTPELSVLVRELVWSIGWLGRRHLATVLIGAGNGNIDLDAAVRTWLRGITYALSGELTDAKAHPTRLETITFVEFDAKRALDIDAVLRESQDTYDTALVDLQYTPLPDAERSRLEKEYLATARRAAQREVQRLRAGGSPRPETDADTPPTRVSFARDGDIYRMGAITAHAAVPEREVKLDPRLVEKANNELAAERNADLQHERGRFMEQLLVPVEFRQHLATDAPLVLMLDATTARIHWEMVAQPLPGPAPTKDQQQDWFLGTARGLTRQLRTTYAPPPEPPPPPRPLLRILVVADPAEDAHLPGAREEGIFVAQLFESFNTLYSEGDFGQVHVERLIGPRSATRTNVLRKIMSVPDRFDVLHFAGHCKYDKEDPSRSGWIFTDNEILSANELNRIDRIPKFVFSNACESGITPDRAEKRDAALAPSFAEAFFARGVANFVCTAWPVDDLAARLFALELYARLLGIDPGFPDQPKPGETPTISPRRSRLGPGAIHVGMHAARRAIMNRSYGARTWGAYQHYGNPHFRLFHPWKQPARDTADT
jgi:pimeloyl-ACP methyl ester carboxylesterase